MPAALTAQPSATQRAIPADANGLFTYADALAHGWTQSSVRRALRLGTWIRVRRGVFITDDAAERAMGDLTSEHVLHAAAALRTLRRHDVVISGRSAALLHRLPLMCASPNAVEVTVPRSHRGALPGVVMRTARAPFGADQVTTVHGLPVTTVARTVVDAASRTTRMEAAVMLDDALRRRLCSRADLHAALADSGARRHAAATHSLIEQAEPRCTDAFTSAVRRDLLDHGEPRGEPGHGVHVRGYGLVPVPLTWPTQRLVVLNGSDPTDGAMAALHGALHATGWQVLTATWNDVVHRPHEVRNRVRGALGRID